ncbi:Trafficking protein particle complex subunit 31 [Entomophthora muscae]|uniref:Trafficking protein particle complex subunit 31 n=1 Tax=Entomophthora muscae TaxID=34485 RepID=A0ACC2RV88_9FUNG|nr:Trafficking protein particle complex subunit 31 [Entomophthora muscae]
MSFRHNPSLSASSVTFSVGHSHTSSLPTFKEKLPVKNVKGEILNKNLHRLKSTEVSLNSFSFLFGELVHYTEGRVTNIQDFESRLNAVGKRVGIKSLELIAGRNKGGLLTAKRQIYAQDSLAYITTNLWTFMFGRPIDTFERSTEDQDEYMLSDNEPVLSQFLSLPKESAQLNANAFLAGVIEGVLTAGQFPCRVTAHSMPLVGFPSRTTFLIKLHSSILEREAIMANQKY